EDHHVGRFASPSSLSMRLKPRSLEWPRARCAYSTAEPRMATTTITGSRRQATRFGVILSVMMVGSQESIADPRRGQIRLPPSDLNGIPPNRQPDLRVGPPQIASGLRGGMGISRSRTLSIR